MSEAYEILGNSAHGGLLIIVDHASNHVPDGIELGIDTCVLQKHIAWDIGVAAVARRIAALADCTAILASKSRLVVDLNRYAFEDAVIPVVSDGVAIPGNRISNDARNVRLRRYYHPYHDWIAANLKAARPALILSLHSFTPQLDSKPEEKRPWEIGILYNQDDRAARLAIPMLEKFGLNVGDQQPYSGKHLNATMNQHAEANSIAYLGVEVRQDLIINETGQERFAGILAKTCYKIIKKLCADTRNEYASNA